MGSLFQSVSFPPFLAPTLDRIWFSSNDCYFLSLRWVYECLTMVMTVESGCGDQVGPPLLQPIIGGYFKLSPWKQEQGGSNSALTVCVITQLSRSLSSCLFLLCLASQCEWVGGCWDDFGYECHCNAVRAQAKNTYWHIDSNKHGERQTVPPP